MAASQIRPQLTRLEQRDVPATPNLFDAAFYLRQNPDVAAAVMRQETTAEQHFRTFGDKEHRSGNPAFDTGFYLTKNSDVLSAVNAGIVTPFAHFEHWGEFEKRDPCVDFGTTDYLRINSDVRSAVDSKVVAPFEHFFKSGQFEGRIPVEGFARRDYLNNNPDVANAYGNQLSGAVVHFMNFGRFEGRERPVGTSFSWTMAQSTPIYGVSQNSNDTKLYSISPPFSGSVTVTVTYTGLRPTVSVENATTNVPMYQRAFIETGVVSLLSAQFTSGVPYLLRVRSSGNSASMFSATFTVV